MSDEQVIRPEIPGVNRRPLDVGQVWTVDGSSGRWFVLTPSRVIALFAGGADHTPQSLVHTYGDRLRLEQIATVYADSVKPDPTNGASIVPGLVERVRWAGRQIDEALADSRVDGAAAAWLRTIKRSLFNASGDVTPEPTEETPTALCEHGWGAPHNYPTGIPHHWERCPGPGGADPKETRE